MITIGNNYNKIAMNGNYIYVQPSKMKDYLADKCRKVNTCIFFQYNGCNYSIWDITEGNRRFMVTDSLTLKEHLSDKSGNREYSIRSVCVHYGRFSCDHQVRCY